MDKLLWSGIGAAMGLGGLLDGFAGILLIPSILYGMAICLFGYKLFKVQLAVSGFCLGAVVGLLLGGLSGGSMAGLLAVALGVLCGWLSLKLYKVGVFLTVSSVTTGILLVLLSVLLGINSLTAVIAMLLGIGAGVAGVLMDRLIIIAFTSISGAMSTGMGIGLVGRSVPMGILIAIPLAAFGIWFQHRLERQDAHKAGVPTASPNAAKAVPMSFKDGKLALTEATKSLSGSAKDMMSAAKEKLDQYGKENPNQTVLVSNKGRMWTDGMPMLVTETQIVTQNGDTEEVLFNLRVQNLSKERITGLYLDVACYDPLKQPVTPVENASFLDLNIAPGAGWHSTNSLKLPDKTTRRCVVSIRNIVFGNEDIWSNEEKKPLRELPEPEAMTLPEALLEEYYTEVEEQLKAWNAKGLHRFAPAREEGYWSCSCGQINLGDTCVCCGMQRDMLFTRYNEQWLQEHREQRLAEKARLEAERRQRMEEQKEAVKQKTKELADQGKAAAEKALTAIRENKELSIKIASVCGAVLVVALVGISIYNSDANRFKRAVENGKQLQALEIFVTSEDGDRIAAEAIRRAAKLHEDYVKERIEYDAAISELQLLDMCTDYSLPELQEHIYAVELLLSMRNDYDNAQQAMENENYGEALPYLETIFREAGDSEDTKKLLEQSKEAYKTAVLKLSEQYVQEDDLHRAVEILEMGNDLLPENSELATRLEELSARLEKEIRLQERNAPYLAMKEELAKISETMILSNQNPRDISAKELILIEGLQLDEKGRPGYLIVHSHDRNDSPRPPHVRAWNGSEMCDYGGFWYADNIAIARTEKGGLAIQTWTNDDAIIYGVFENDQFYNTQFKMVESIGKLHYTIQESIYNVDGKQRDGIPRTVSKEEYYQEMKVFEDLNWTSVVTCDRMGTSTTRDDIYTVYTNSKQSIEDAIAELDKRIASPLEQE